MDTYMRSIDELRLIAESRKSMIKILLWMLLIAVMLIATLGFIVIDNQKNVEAYISSAIEYRYAELLIAKKELTLKYECLQDAIDFCTDKNLEKEIIETSAELYWETIEEEK